MSQIPRREFLERAVVSAGAAAVLPAIARGAASKSFAANDRVTLGSTGIKMSRLGIGTGTHGGRDQRALGIKGLADLFKHGYDRGITYWDLADAYRTHAYAKEALKTIPRDKLVILTKTRARGADLVKADIDRFLLELGIDHVDICLMHCMTKRNWTTDLRPCLDVLSEAKKSGKVRAVGCSSHSVQALENAAESDWVDVVLARINHTGAKMDAIPEKVVPAIKKIHAAGKGILGMKIIGEGLIAGQRQESLDFVLNLGCVHAFNVGFTSKTQIDDIISRMSKVTAKA